MMLVVQRLQGSKDFLSKQASLNFKIKLLDTTTYYYIGPQVLQKCTDYPVHTLRAYKCRPMILAK